MKRVLALLLVAMILAGCSVSGTRMKEPVTFYYLRTHTGSNTYDDFFSEGIIGSETREASDHRGNLSYLLTVYFRGPLNPELTSPFPMGCRILEIKQEDRDLTILLSPILAESSDLDITIACACLAKTCMELTNADTVQIESWNLEDKLLFSRTFTQDNLFLNDDYPQNAENTEITQ